MNPTIAQIWIYPIKSLDGIAVDSVEVLTSGALAGDRAYALLDAQGKFINGKRNPKIHALRATFDLAGSVVTLTAPPSRTATFHLEQEQTGLERWLEEYFGQSVTLAHNLERGFPDDTDSPGPTVISQATLIEVASWFPDLDEEEVRRRMRTNLEVTGVDPFWEDHLFGAAGETVPFQIGTVPLLGVNPCQRCVVPTRNSQTGEASPGFQAKFTRQRQATLPETVVRDRFNHFYRLAVNTRAGTIVPGNMIHCGDRVKL